MRPLRPLLRVETQAFMSEEMQKPRREPSTIEDTAAAVPANFTFSRKFGETGPHPGGLFLTPNLCRLLPCFNIRLCPGQNMFACADVQLQGTKMPVLRKNDLGQSVCIFAIGCIFHEN